jgi:ectoine hydroxylase-related dioxygenase (phytanoyl-CoA dioxygenase family)
MITQPQVEQYREHGYLLVEDVLDAGKIATLRRLADSFVARAADMTGSDDVLDLDPAHRPEVPKVRRIKKPHGQHPFFRELAADPGIVAVISRLIGPDIRLHGSKLNLKSAGHGAPVEWHQDWAFYPHTNDDLLAVGIPLDDFTPDNGPLLVIPGTHRGPTHDHHRGGRFVGALDPVDSGVDVRAAVPLLARAGSITVHHVRLVHGSAPNRSPRQRRLLLFEYAAADAWSLRGMECGFDEYKGLMVAGRFTLVPRVVPAPIRMPWPSRGDTIYEIQQGFTKERGSAFADALM